MSPLTTAIALAIASLLASVAAAQDVNYDESKVPAFTLPDPLIDASGKAVATPEAWRSRREEIFRLFEDHVYGRMPGKVDVRVAVTEEPTEALEGKALREQITLHFGPRENGPAMHLLIYRPNEAKEPVPAFLGLNFFGNHSIHPDPAIHLSKAWMRESKDKAIVDNRATEASRGKSASRWPVETIVGQSYALVTAYYGDLDPDYDDSFGNGVHPIFEPPHSERPLELWGAIGAWAWGLSRALDYLESIDSIDAKRIAVFGHSRLGKTALWAGACDERFALVISNESGCGGAALSRRRYGETIERITTRFPHWFCGKLWTYNGREDAIPVDQHQLIALIAPRPVYVASAEEDRWADPKGEFLSLVHAEPVYRLLGKKGLGTSEYPRVEEPIHGEAQAYHVRKGPHDVRPFDWQQFLKYADEVMK
ncbi:MAG: acetylxylan esterase [Planctomycetota bacterium]